MRVLKFKINNKKSKIPKYIKFPNYVYPPYPKDKKPNPLLFQKIEEKKPEFMMEVEKNKLGYSFKRIDPFPHVWTHVNWFFLYKDKEHKELYKSDEKDAMHLERQSYRVCRIVFDEKYKSLTNDINYYAGKKSDDLKLFGKSFVHFDLISDKIYKDNFELLPLNVTKKFTKIYLNKSLKILEKKSTKPKELFGRLMYLNQQIFNSYQKYDLVILANKLNDYKYFLLNEDDPSSYATLFFNTLQEFINIYCKILNVKNTVDAITPIFTHLSFDKDKKIHNKNYLILVKHLEKFSKN